MMVQMTKAPKEDPDLWRSIGKQEDLTSLGQESRAVLFQANDHLLSSTAVTHVPWRRGEAERLQHELLSFTGTCPELTAAGPTHTRGLDMIRRAVWT